MLFTPAMLIQAVLFGVGIWWCSQILPRWRDDLRKLRKPKDSSDRASIAILWSITGLVAFLCLGFGLTIVWNIVRVRWHW
jgi:hypothetical protein